jgi:surface-anchored protein
MVIAAGEHDHHEDEHEEEGHEHGHEPLDHAEIVGGPKAVQISPDGAAWSFLGGPDRYFYVLPQSEISGLPFLGLNSEELNGEDFATAPTLILTSVEGPGDFFLYQVDAFGQPVVIMNSADSVEDSYVLPLGTHVHMNWAFSEPGEYELTFDVSATLTGGTQLVSEPQVVHYHIVGQTTYIHEGHADIGLHYEADHGLEFFVAADGEHHHGEEEHEEAHDHEDEAHDHEHEHGEEMHPADVTFLLGGHAMMVIPDEADYAFLGEAGMPVYRIGQQPEEGVPFAGWSAEELDPAVFTENISIELHEVNGPGAVFLWEVDTFGAVNIFWDSTDPAEDILSLPAGIHRHYNLAVTQPGIYELEVHAEGTLVAGGDVEAHTVITLQAGGLEGYFAHFERIAPSWIDAETGGWLHSANWPWLWSPEQGWIYAWGNGGPAHYYFRAEDSAWLWTTPDVFPYYWDFQGTEWIPWSNNL